MKKIFILLFISTTIFSKEFTVIKRDKKFRLKESIEKLTDLESSETFEGRYFKIVKSVNDEHYSGKIEKAIRFDDENRELALKAATAYFHLTIARNFFIDTFKSDFVKKLHKVTIRIEMEREFNAIGHFAHANKPKDYNNALTIPGGEARPNWDIHEWKPEIWFRPMKEVEIPRSLRNIGDQQVASVLKIFRKQAHDSTFMRLLSQSANAVSNSATWTSYQPNLIRTVGTSVMIEAAYYGMKYLGKLFSPRRIALDTVMIPEIIYHEFSHMALSDFLKTTHSSPVNEGFADYFSALISKSPKLATRIKKYGKNIKGKKGTRKRDTYTTLNETHALANSDFVLGLLWSLRTKIGPEMDLIYYNLRKDLTSSSSIRNLIGKISSACKKLCKKPNIARYQIAEVLRSKGL